MAIYKIADPARADLQEIWQYISRDDEDIATQFIRELIEKFILLADNRHDAVNSVLRSAHSLTRNTWCFTYRLKEA
jgi:plasmid stabilization system protein ParE